MGFYIPYNGAPFNGIFGVYCFIEDPLSSSRIIVSPSSEHALNVYGHGNSIINGSHERGWYSGNIAYSYINLSLPFSSLLLTHYSLQSPNHPSDTYHLKSWKLLAKNINDSSWALLDERINQTVLLGNGKYSTFACVSPRRFNIFQIQMIGPNSCGDYYFGLKQVEFFGTIWDSGPSFDYYYTPRICIPMFHSLYLIHFTISLMYLFLFTI